MWLHNLHKHSKPTIPKLSNSLHKVLHHSLILNYILIVVCILDQMNA